MLDAIGIGNALIDFIVPVDEDTLARFELRKGTMQLIDERATVRMMNKLKGRKVTILPGGSAGNTMIGMAKMGAKAALCGKIGKDFHGAQFSSKLKAAKVLPRLVSVEGLTGTCISLVSPDKERTMATCLGVSASIEPGDVDWQDFQDAKILHVEGYLLSNESQARTILAAMRVAKREGMTISFDMADPFMVKEHAAQMRRIIKEFAEVVFCNEAEARALTGLPPAKAIRKIGGPSHTIAIKLGKKGSLVRSGKKVIKIPARLVKAVDTTGAGDLYAAGFLYGVAQGMTPRRCGLHGSFLASEIVAQYGAYLKRHDAKGLRSWLAKR